MDWLDWSTNRSSGHTMMGQLGHSGHSGHSGHPGQSEQSGQTVPSVGSVIHSIRPDGTRGCCCYRVSSETASWDSWEPHLTRCMCGVPREQCECWRAHGYDCQGFRVENGRFLIAPFGYVSRISLRTYAVGMCLHRMDHVDHVDHVDHADHADHVDRDRSAGSIDTNNLD